MRNNSYLCSMNAAMKMTALMALLLPCAAFAQNLGVNITYPQATLHVHSDYEFFPFLPEPIDRWGDPEPPIGDEHYYLNTVLLTNSGTGATATDGFLINQVNGDMCALRTRTRCWR